MKTYFLGYVKPLDILSFESTCPFKLPSLDLHEIESGGKSVEIYGIFRNVAYTTCTDTNQVPCTEQNLSCGPLAM